MLQIIPFYLFVLPSWYDPAWCCQTDKCTAAKTLAGPTATSPPSISTYQHVTTVPYLGMLWHGTALAHQSLTDTAKNTCASSTSNQMVIPIVNKQWHNGVGGGGAYHPVGHVWVYFLLMSWIFRVGPVQEGLVELLLPLELTMLSWDS